MKPDIDALKKKFREGHHAAAIGECEALCRQNAADREIKRLCAMMHALVGSYARALELLHQVRNPDQEDPDVLFNIALCERELKDFEKADQHLRIYTDAFPGNSDGWTTWAECKFQLNEFEEGIRLADRAIKLDASSLAAWTVRGNCQKSIRQFEQALESFEKANRIQPTGEAAFNAGLGLVEISRPAEAIDRFTQAIQLTPNLPKLLIARGDALHGVGKLQEAAADYKAALALAPADGETLKKATVCLLDLGQGDQALDLCRDILKVHPDNLTARLGEQWVLSQLVPLWHVPMMNEPERNQAYYEGLKSVVAPGKLVLEIGTGSGLMAMMAARLGARKVVTCEAVGLVARTARKIVQRNHLEDRVTVLAKPSYEVQVGRDLPAKADILVHEIFSSELLGEHVLPAIEDARKRLLKPDAIIMPSCASIMIALVGGDELGRNVYAGESFGFDLRDFNAIYPKKRPLYREDLSPVLMSDPVEAFRFDFSKQPGFAAERKRIEVTAHTAGLCYGVIQWIRIDMAEGVQFENRPSGRRAVANWQQTTYGFEEPIDLKEGSVVPVDALHNCSRPWFELAPGGLRGALPGAT